MNDTIEHEQTALTAVQFLDFKIQLNQILTLSALDLTIDEHGFILNFNQNIPILMLDSEELSELNVTGSRLHKIENYEIRYSAFQKEKTVENIRNYIDEILEDECKRKFRDLAARDSGQAAADTAVIRLECHYDNLNLNDTANHLTIKRRTTGRKSKKKIIMKNKKTTKNSISFYRHENTESQGSFDENFSQFQPEFSRQKSVPSSANGVAGLHDGTTASNMFQLGAPVIDTPQKNKFVSNSTIQHPELLTQKPELPIGWTANYDKYGREIFYNKEKQLSTLNKNRMLEMATKRHARQKMISENEPNERLRAGTKSVASTSDLTRTPILKLPDSGLPTNQLNSSIDSITSTPYDHTKADELQNLLKKSRRSTKKVRQHVTTKDQAAQNFEENNYQTIGPCNDLTNRYTRLDNMLRGMESELQYVGSQPSLRQLVGRFHQQGQNLETEEMPTSSSRRNDSDELTHAISDLALDQGVEIDTSEENVNAASENGGSHTLQAESSQSKTNNLDSQTKTARSKSQNHSSSNLPISKSKFSIKVAQLDQNSDIETHQKSLKMSRSGLTINELTSDRFEAKLAKIEDREDDLFDESVAPAADAAGEEKNLTLAESKRYVRKTKSVSHIKVPINFFSGDGFENLSGKIQHSGSKINVP